MTVEMHIKTHTHTRTYITAIYVFYVISSFKKFYEEIKLAKLKNVLLFKICKKI